MSRRKNENNDIRSLQKHSGSYTVTLPPEVIRKFKWKEKQKLVVREYGKGKIIVEDWPRK